MSSGQTIPSDLRTSSLSVMFPATTAGAQCIAIWIASASTQFPAAVVRANSRLSEDFASSPSISRAIRSRSWCARHESKPAKSSCDWSTKDSLRMNIDPLIRLTIKRLASGLRTKRRAGVCHSPADGFLDRTQQSWPPRIWSSGRKQNVNPSGLPGLSDQLRQVMRGSSVVLATAMRFECSKARVQARSSPWRRHTFLRQSMS
jgi:hypothetical protein